MHEFSDVHPVHPLRWSIPTSPLVQPGVRAPRMATYSRGAQRPAPWSPKTHCSQELEGCEVGANTPIMIVINGIKWMINDG